jgi:hypothetical protein
VKSGQKNVEEPERLEDSRPNGEVHDYAPLKSPESILTEALPKA